MNASNQFSSKRYIPALTGMRAIAAFMVYISHNAITPYPIFNTPWLINLLNKFSIGVSIFFVLSGFLITLRYASSIKPTKSWLIQYLTKRMARIYPLYFLITIITFIASQLSLTYDQTLVWKFFNTTQRIFILILNLTFLRGLFTSFVWSLVGQGWSLTVEECFYVAAPLILLSTAKYPKLLAAWPILLALTGVLLVKISNLAPERSCSFFETIPFMLSWTFFGRSFEFLAGMALALFLLKNKSLQFQVVNATSLGILWIIGCLISMGNLPGVPSITTASNHVPLYTIMYNIILPIGIAILLWGLIKERTWLRYCLETKLFNLLGKSSYAFYLIHIGVLNTFVEHNITRNTWVRFILLNAAAIALYKLIEHPINRWLVRRLESKFSAQPIHVSG